MEVGSAAEVLPVPDAPPAVSERPETVSGSRGRGKKRKARPPRDATAPRQPLTGYVRYLNERRERLRADNPNLGFAEVTRRLAGEWGRLPAGEKQQYLAAAEQDRERYVREWSAYKQTEAYRAFRQRQLDHRDTVASAKKSKPVGRLSDASANEKPAESNVNGNASNPAPPGRPKSSVAPTVNSDPEVDIPIFTEQFLQHNKLRETELRQLRKENIDYEQQNAILQKHIENMKGVVERTKSETAVQAARTVALRAYFNNLVERLVNMFGTLALPGGPAGATKQNIEEYMETLQKLAIENKNDTHVKQARELLSKLDIAT